MNVGVCVVAVCVGMLSWCRVVPAQQDLDPKQHVFVRTTLPKRVFVREAVTVVVRFGIGVEFRAQNLIPLIQRRLDLPVQVRALPVTGAVPFEAAGVVPADRKTSTVVFNDVVTEARQLGVQELDGRRFDVFETTMSLLPEAAGEIMIAAPTLRLAYATHFESDFVNERVPSDRTERTVEGIRQQITVLPYPEPVPAGFGGAVGQFTLKATVTPTEVELGQGLSVQLTLEGTGELHGFPMPRFAARPGLELRGTLVGAEKGRRLVTHDLLPTRTDLDAVPSFQLVTLDPTTGRYHTVETAPVPITVRAGAGADVPERTDTYVPVWLDWSELDFASLQVRRSGGVILLLLPLLLPWLVFVGMWAFRKRRERLLKDPGRSQALRAYATFQDALRERAPEADAFLDYLAARLRCPRAAIIGDGLGARLRDTGVPEPLVTRTTELWAASQRARFSGGGAGSSGQDGFLALAADLEQVFVAHDARRGR